MAEPLWPSAKSISTEKYNPLDDETRSNFSMANSCASNFQYNNPQHQGNFNFRSCSNLMTPTDCGTLMSSSFGEPRQNNYFCSTSGGMQKSGFWNGSNSSSPGNGSFNKSSSAWPPVDNFQNNTPRYDPAGIYQGGQPGGYNTAMNNESGRMFSSRSSGSNPNGSLWMNVQPRSSNLF